ncbi:histone-lysine N-methyltransferase SETMAR [Denticeps clupeoides]|uniref:Histone-lysine N-methyltransferase SETMAR n=1 Tax=Denticeps clupeoides TaxID=299321 RepID=A0AAY4EEC7_9TELE|nr:histone-lysine N-methyltransferase SETMAR [Denticeps clupeoides]
MRDLSHGLENVAVAIDENAVREYGFPEFEYTPENVSGPGCSADPGEVTLPGCECRAQSCHPATCGCQRRFGPPYDERGGLLRRQDDGTGLCRPVMECNVLCGCGESCRNRVVLRVFRTQDRGWGVQAAEAVPRGRFVCEYAGEVIGREEAQRRQLAQGPGDMNYIIAVREHAGQGPAHETFVDPARVGNVGRFINHSCQPNLVMTPVRVHSAVPRLALFAGRDIAAHEEVTFDYSGRFGNGEGGPGEPGGTKGTHQRKPCYCGTQKCAGFLPLDVTVLHS